MNINHIKKELLQIEEQLEIIENFSKRKVSGRLHCKKSNGCFQYLIDGKYLKSKDIKLAKQISLRDFYNKEKPILERKKRVLEEFLSECENDSIGILLKSLPEGRRRLLTECISTPEDIIQAFENEMVLGKAFDVNDKSEFYTAKGERVRSKSEILIANELTRHGIAYKYERPLHLIVNNRECIFYPDFTIMCPKSGQLKYLEHLGKLDTNAYYDNTMSKLDAFERNGLLIGRDIILLHESSAVPLSSKVVAEYIEEFFINM